MCFNALLIVTVKPAISLSRVRRNTDRPPSYTDYLARLKLYFT